MISGVNSIIVHRRGKPFAVAGCGRGKGNGDDRGASLQLAAVSSVLLLRRTTPGYALIVVKDER